MKIIFVIQGLKKGGAERVVSIIANKFNELGNEVSIVLTETVEGIAYPLNHEIKIINATNKEEHTNIIIKRLNVIRNLRKVIENEKPDVCISFITRTNIYSIIAGIGLKTPIIISERNNPLVDPKSRVTRLLRDIFYPFANGFVFQTDFAARCFSKRIIKKSTIIPNPVTDEVLNKPDIVEKRKEIIAVCRLEEQKNLPMLINAFSKISRDNKEYSLVIYGEGSMREHLEQLIKKLNVDNKVKLLGQRDDVVKLMFEAEIFVLSSNFEGMPNALAEAMSVGLACISTDCPSYGSRFLIKNEQNGILIPVGDQSALEQSLIKLIENPELKLKVSKNAESIANELSAENISNLWIKYLERVTNK